MFVIQFQSRLILGRRLGLRIAVAGAILIFVFAQSMKADDPAYWAFAPTPPMGWNSYDTFGSSVTEDEFLANARYIKDHLLSHGWNYAVIDYRWSDPDASKHDLNGVKDNLLTMDEYGRLLPAPNRFPSAVTGQGFKPLADQIHALGLKFGIHVMRGIPRQAVMANTPIEGSSYHAGDAADTQSTCLWCADMFGVKGKESAGHAYYDSIFRLYASWGVDYVKVDDLSHPYSGDEIEAVRSAIDQCGRPIVFSTSPGKTPVNEKEHISIHANMWRISSDFWDNWKLLNDAFDLAAAWQGVGGPGRWPDSDMIPFGRVGLRSVGGPRMTHFTHGEQITLLSLWSLVSSPLMLGTSLTDCDEWTLSLITNDEMIAIDQDPLGKPASLVSKQNGLEVWARDLSDGSKAIGLFNRTEADAQVTAKWSDAGLSVRQAVHDVWQHKDLGVDEDQISLPVPRHGAVLLCLKGN
jgi:alpha-galactosidase